MKIDLSFLDYLWRGLTVGTMASTAILLVMAVGFFIRKNKSSQQQMKWFFNSQLCLLLFVCTGSFILVAMIDPELAAGCFNQFVKASSSFSITRIVSGAWLTIFALLVTKDILSIYLSVIRSKKFRPINSGIPKMIFEESISKLGLKNKIELYSSTKSVSPFVWGIFRYKLIVPQIALDSLSEKSLKNIFAHELSHIKDRDSIWLFLELLCRRLLFFHPLANYIGKKHRLIIEKAADEQAVKKGGIRSSDLLKSLVEVVTLCKSHNPSPMAAHASRNFLEIQERMVALGQIEDRNSSKHTFYFTMAIGFLASLSFSVAQAKLSMTGINDNSHSVGSMCSQVTHEKIIESWLNIKPVTNKCEK